MAKSYEEYKSDYLVLLDIYRCSTRYLAERAEKVSIEQQKIDIELTEKFRQYYHTEFKKLESECKKNTGRILLNYY